ncbi:MAG TPA: AAA family ATPase, partial [Ilumatobacteraceae bacterium]|nr:AAA family ATPase [Ilumatobacteraceae bacterium]
MGTHVGLSPTMIGRSAQFEQLIDLIDSGLCGCNDLPTIIMVSGEAGVGKTRLCNEALAHFPTANIVATSADLADEAIALSTARRLLPANGDWAKHEDDAEALAEALAAHLAGGSGGIVALEDVHWIDAQSASVIDRLIRLVVPGLVVLLTFRPDELHRRRAGGQLVLRLERRQAIDRIPLDRLDRSEVGLLLRNATGATPPSGVIAAIHERTGGNPFAVEELVRAYGASRLDDLTSGALPWTLAEVVAERLHGLSVAEREVIEAAAICGMSMSFDLLASVVGRTEDELLTVLRTLVDRGLLEERSDDDFVFSHALVREAVSQQLLGRQRRRLHERVLALMGDSPELAVRARHAYGAGRLDEFVALARDAAAAALAAGSTFEALRLATDALREDPDDAALLLTAAQSAWLVGAFDETKAAAERLLRNSIADDDVERQADALRWQIRAAFEQSDSTLRDVGLAQLEALLERLPEGECRASATVAIAQTHMLAHRPLLAIEWSDRALAEAEAGGFAHLAVQSRLERASAAARLPHADSKESARELLTVVEDAERIGNWTVFIRGINNALSDIPVHSAQGRALIERFRTATRRSGYDWMGTSMLALREVEIAHGDSDLAATRRALARAAEWWSTDGRKSTWILAVELDLALEEGQVAKAAELIIDLTPELCHGKLWRDAIELRIRAAAGDADVAEFFETMTIPEADNEIGLKREVLMLVEAALRAGVSPDRVRQRVLDELLAGAPPTRARVELMVHGLTAAAAGCHDDAVKLLEEELHEPDPSLPRHAVGGLRLQLVESLLAVGNRADAAHHLSQALESELSRWPGWRRDRAEALQTRLAGRTVQISGELTAREREVAGLLAEGLTNGQL